MERHPEISKRRAEALSKLRGESMNEETINHYFQTLATAYEKCKVLSNGESLKVNQVFCIDETGICASQKQGYVLAKRGSRKVF